MPGCDDLAVPGRGDPKNGEAQRPDHGGAVQCVHIGHGNLDIDQDEQAPARAFTYLLLLCRAHRLTSYDAVYLDLASRRRLPLATLDIDLRKAAKKLGIKLLGL